MLTAGEPYKKIRKTRETVGENPYPDQLKSLTLSEHYHLSKDDYKADKWMQFAYDIAGQAGNKRLVEYLKRRSKK